MGKERKPLALRFWGPIHLVALVDLMLFGLLSLSEGTFRPAVLGIGAGMALMVYVSGALLMRFRMGDSYLWTLVSMLLSIGLAEQVRLSLETGQKQFVWILVGAGVFLATYKGYQLFRERLQSPWLCFGGMVGLFLLTFVLGTEIKGARNWIALGGFTFQPSELIKILFVFFMASAATEMEALQVKAASRVIPGRWVLMGLVFTVLGFFALQREFGTALLVFGVYLSYLYVFMRDPVFPVLNLALAGAGGAAALKVVHHLQVRVDTWLDPWADISGKGYQITQSLFALGAGGFFGTGLGLGHPGYIPAVHTDFIFAALCEEMGILGGIGILLLFFMLSYRGIKIAIRLQDRYLKALAFGLTLTFGYQTFIIIGGVVKLIPLTGITLPFISYGGSSMLSSCIALGILQALSGEILRKEAELHEPADHQ